MDKDAEMTRLTDMIRHRRTPAGTTEQNCTAKRETRDIARLYSSRIWL